MTKPIGTLEQKEGRVSADGEGITFLPNVTAERFEWYLSLLADATNNAANPEHCYRSTIINGIPAVSEIIAGWGGITTRFYGSQFHDATKP
jgi:hypothetical protein